MPKRRYITVADELTEHADAAIGHFRTRGFSVRIEQSDSAFPSTPTLVCRRKPRTMIVEVDDRVRHEKVRIWCSYAKSCPGDTRVALCLPNGASTTVEEDSLRRLGAGLYVSEAGALIERVPPMDLGVLVQLPDLASLPTKTRKALAPAYEQFEHSHWREGFEDACQTVEVEGRRYLRRNWQRRRFVVMRENGRIWPFVAKEVNRMTVGSLVKAFKGIQTPNKADTLVMEVLELINPQRVGVVHKKLLPSTEAGLRPRVGQHMWRLINALRAIFGE